MEQKIDRLDKKIDILIEIVKGIDKKVSDLWKFTNMDVYKEFPPFITSKSPIELNSVGKSILTKYLGAKYIDEKKDTLISEIYKMNFKSPLDIQNFSEKLIFTKFNTPDFIKIKNLIYKNPIWENQSVNTKIMSLIMGLYLRDKYFNKYPELNTQ